MITGRWLAGAAALIGTGSAQGAPPPQCLSPVEAQALAIVLLPDAAEAVGKQCVAALPETATLRGGLAPLTTRWRAEGAAVAVTAATAGTKLAGGAGGGSAADSAAMLQLIRSAIVADMVKSITPKTCGIIERAATLLAPLPAANLAGLVVMAIQESAGGRGAFICEAPRS